MFLPFHVSKYFLHNKIRCYYKHYYLLPAFDKNDVDEKQKSTWKREINLNILHACNNHTQKSFTNKKEKRTPNIMGYAKEVQRG